MPQIDLESAIKPFLVARQILHDDALYKTTLSQLDANTSTDASEVVEILRPLFCDEAWLPNLVQQWLEITVKSQMIMAPIPGPIGDGGSDIINSGVLLQHPCAVVAAQSLDGLALAHIRRSGYSNVIDLTGQTTMIGVLNDVALECDLLEFTPLTEGSDLAIPLRLVSSRNVTLSKHSQPLVFDGAKTGIRIKSASGTVIMLSAAIGTGGLSYRVGVDVDTGSIVKVYANKEADNIARTMMAILRHQSDAERGAILRRFLSHRSFFMRWQALRELVALDPSSALAAIQDHEPNEQSTYVIRGIERLKEYLRTSEEV